MERVGQQQNIHNQANEVCDKFKGTVPRDFRLTEKPRQAISMAQSL